MAMALANGRVEEKLAQRMSAAGFALAGKEVLHENPMGRFLYHDNEMIFNRGLGGKRSNFYVFATTEKDGSLTVQYYNPDQNGLRLSRYSVHRRFRLPASATESQVSATVGRIMKDSAKKKDTELFLNLHEHFGRLSPPYTGRKGERVVSGMVDYDDGVSFLTDNVRKYLYYHLDYAALTPHNSVVRAPFAFLSWAGHHLGFTPIPGVEITASFGVNGPHVLALGRNFNALLQVKKAILDVGERGDMPAYFSSMDSRMGFDDILSILFRLQNANQIALCLAHPVNFNSPNIPAPLVGLYSAVDTGHLSLDDAHRYASHFDSVAMWNASLYAKAHEVPVADAELRTFLQQTNRKHIRNKRLLANPTNLALARELHEKFGLHTHFETDEHATLPLILGAGGGYAVGGDRLGMGATVMELSKEFFEAMGRKPDLGQLIDLIRSKDVDMHGRVFAVNASGGMAVRSERTKLPHELRHIHRRYSRALSLRYAGMVVRDFFGFLLNGEVDKIKHMPGS